MENKSILSHVSIGTNDYEKAKEFYTELFSCAGIKVVEDLKQFKVVGFGKQFPEFWVGETEEGPATPGNGVHVSFLVDNNEQVDTFYKKAIDLGAKDNGAPGPRPHYGPEYYGAFMIDPDGNKIEVMYWNES